MTAIFMRISDVTSDVCSSDLDGVHRRAGARPCLCMEEGSARLGVRPQSGPVELDRNAGSSIVPPDQTYFNDLNGELTDKGFLVTSTEDLFQWARTGSL